MWLRTYRTPDMHPKLSAAERAYIGHESQTAQRVPWSKLLRHSQAWTLIAAKFITDPIWWFFLFWLPKFLHAQYGLSLLELGLPLVVVFVLADLGSIAGGWLAGRLIRLGWSVNRARKGAMLACALMIVPVVFAAKANHLWLAVALIGMATAGHQGWSANVYTLASDLFPRDAVASVVGMGGFAGAVGGMLISTVIGLLLQATGSYVPVFMLAGSAYLIALGVVHALAPRLQPVRLQSVSGSAGVGEPL
jgi:ACS family hexuronate transporter-like MFS transporter